MATINEFEKFTNLEILNFFKIGETCDALFLTKEEAWMNRYQFNEKWGDNASMGMFANGSGDDLFVVVRDGIIIKGFDHESSLSRHARDDFSIYPGMYTNLPGHLDEELRDAAIEFENVTFCYWRTAPSGAFASGIEIGRHQDGAGFLLSNIYTTADDYIADARDYFEVEDSIKEAAVRELYAIIR